MGKEIDKYTYFNDMQLADFNYIIHTLAGKGIISINNSDELNEALLSILEDYAE